METQVTKDQFEQVAKSVQRIESALLGDSSMKIVGLVDKVDKHEKYIEKSKTRLGWWTGAAAGLGLVCHQIIDWIKTH
jgi:hypothetical protein